MTTAPPSDPSYDIEFFWDPVCPFAWVTSRWIERVAAQKQYRVDWRFISLRLLNKEKDYDTEFPAGYEHGHTAGLRMLRVAAAVARTSDAIRSGRSSARTGAATGTSRRARACATT